ncbi:hypothetical protein GQ464_011330 [Rhodocaloribacter litoris]|uniref:hypothetical protein n=1 Tax=Rhodocaloribacter litoris TaxID=2558931 RepID=UPI001E314358|nr:hypothetical protein [Rhodocaloribacter litoris]QXD14050.1 hypothetical protein GQ464_011330 [Rhodocaloribacter litoris]
MTAAESAAQKTGWLRERLAPWADRLAPLEAVPEPQRWGYRENVCLSTAWVDGVWHFGLRRRDELIPIPDCPVHAPRVRAVVRSLARVLPPGPSFPMVYLVQSRAQVVLVVKARAVEAADALGSVLGEALAGAGVEGVWLHLNPSAGRRVFARRAWRLLWGVPRSRDADGLLYGPAAFSQLLPVLHRRALDAAEAFLAPAPGTAVVDLYCGTGASLVRWLRAGAAAAGVELGGEAVACARENAPDALILRGACAQRLPQLTAWAEGHTGPRRLYANPPRTGLEPEVLRWIAGVYRPGRLAYLSCSAGTLRRDLDALTGAGYRVARLVPYDFFPQTYHVEVLALLEDVSPSRSPTYSA